MVVNTATYDVDKTLGFRLILFRVLSDSQVNTSLGTGGHIDIYLASGACMLILQELDDEDHQYKMGYVKLHAGFVGPLRLALRVLHRFRTFNRLTISFFQLAEDKILRTLKNTINLRDRLTMSSTGLFKLGHKVLPGIIDIRNRRSRAFHLLQRRTIPHRVIIEFLHIDVHRQSRLRSIEHQAAGTA